MWVFQSQCSFTKGGCRTSMFTSLRSFKQSFFFTIFINTFVFAYYNNSHAIECTLIIHMQSNSYVYYNFNFTKVPQKLVKLTDLVKLKTNSCRDQSYSQLLIYCTLILSTLWTSVFIGGFLTTSVQLLQKYVVFHYFHGPLQTQWQYKLKTFSFFIPAAMTR